MGKAVYRVPFTVFHALSIDHFSFTELFAITQFSRSFAVIGSRDGN
jgi:hypothetical protein